MGWLVAFSIVYLLFHGGLYFHVLSRDRNHITQTGLGLLGLVPGVGVYVLGQQALMEAGVIKVPRLPPSEPGKPPVVGTVTEFRAKVKEAEPPPPREGKVGSIADYRKRLEEADD